VLGLTDVAMGLALLNRFKDVVPGIAMVNRDVVFVPEENAQRLHAERAKKDILNFISVWRTGTAFEWERNQSPAANVGLFTHLDTGSPIAVFKGKKALPVALTYDVVYWAKNKPDVNEYLQQLLWWVHDDPDLKFTAFTEELPFCFDMHFEPPDEEVKDWFKDARYYVVRHRIKIDGYVLKDIREFQVNELILRVFLEGQGEDVLAFVKTITGDDALPAT